ncbi:MAG TPA: hypothetical protein VMX55_06005, partial [candidate division Zixibacteria bacterium]|nr:hypothetical protein [candidate division Zixibacteria bacterium]
NVKFIEKGFFDDDCGVELETSGVVLLGTIAYVANGDQGLEILDISNPLKPIQLSAAETFGTALDLVVYSNIAYVAKNNGVAIFDVSDPRNPILLSTIYLSDTKEVAIRSNLLYVVSGINGFYLFEVSNPAEPLYVSNWRGSFHLNGISVISKFVCLASDGGLEIIDLTFPQRPFRGSFLNISSDIATGVDCVEINNQKFAFVAINYDGLIIVNFTLPNLPQKIAEYTDSRIIDVVYYSGFLYCSTFNSGLEIIDISDIKNPSKEGDYDTDGRCIDASPTNSKTALADSENGIVFLNTINKQNPIKYSSFFDKGEATRIVIEGDLAFVSDRTGGLEIFNLSNIDNIDKIATFNNGEEINAVDVTINNDIAILSAFEKGIMFIDISNPNNPLLLNSYYNGFHAQRTVVKDNLVYVGTFNDTLLILDISNINSISLVGSYVFPKDALVEGLLIDGDILYVGATTLGIYSLNVSNPASIQMIDFIEDSGQAFDFTKTENYLIVADGSAGLKIYDVSTNELIEISSATVFGVSRELVLYNEFIFVADSSKGLTVYNISDKYSPIEVGRYTTHRIRGIKFYEQYIVIGATFNGTRILSLDSDGDTLTDFDEINVYGTNPYNYDTDGDFASDGFEVKYGFNPLDPEDGYEDPDSDELINSGEDFYNTNPFNNDTDLDGMPDGYEVTYKLDPLVNDADNDKDLDDLTNFEEFLLGTNPRKYDTDDDDFSDGVEVAYGTDPFNSKDNPLTRFIKRVVSVSVIGSALLAVSIVFLVREIKRRIKWNHEREKMLQEEEEEILVF